MTTWEFSSEHGYPLPFIEGLRSLGGGGGGLSTVASDRRKKRDGDGREPARFYAAKRAGRGRDRQPPRRSINLAHVTDPHLDATHVGERATLRLASTACAKPRCERHVGALQAGGFMPRSEQVAAAAASPEAERQLPRM
jgi:hypothetical protein